MDLSAQFKYFFSRHPLPKDKPLLLAVSGGLDSVVLCSLCREAGFSFVMAHVNFGLRGEESERDEAFVRALAAGLDVPVEVKKFDTATLAQQMKVSVQEAARNLRYEWFATVAKERGCAAIVTAHHADDNIETVLMNFFRGTGLRGLTGIPASTGLLLRPMLEMRRESILAYAKEKKLGWVEDSSNSSSKYTRNYFRNEVIPSIKKVYPEVEENILGNISRFARVRSFYESALHKIKQDLVEQFPHDLRMPIRKLKKHDASVILFEILHEYGFSENQLPEALKLLDSHSGKFIAGATHRLIRHRDWLILAPSTGESGMVVIPPDVPSVSFNGRILRWERKMNNGGKPDPSPMIAQLDAKDIRFPLLLRPLKEGDYFYPLGMRKKKKVSRFLMDLKLSRNEKEKVWVLESDQRILWVVGLRIDDRFKITGSTGELLVFTLSSH